MKRQVKQPNTIFTVLRNNAQGKYNMQIQDRKELTIVSDDDRKSCGIDLLNDRSIAIVQPKRHDRAIICYSFNTFIFICHYSLVLYSERFAVTYSRPYFYSIKTND